MNHFFQQRAAWVLIGCVVLLVIVVAVRWGAGGGARTIDRWYFDLETRELVAFAPDDEQLPVTLPSGHDGVLAHVFGCGDCQDENRFIGYLESAAGQAEPFQGPPARLDPDSPPPPPMDPGAQQRVAAVPQGSATIEWVPMRSSKGMEIVNVHPRCPDRTVRTCRP